MAMPAIFGAERWAGLGHHEFERVSTGGASAWVAHTSLVNKADYRNVDCANDNAYRQAAPFVQAVWHIVMNRDENGNPLFNSRSAAVTIMADLLLDTMRTYGNTSVTSWHRCACRAAAHSGVIG